MDQREFNSDIRAPPFEASRKTVIKVPGFYATRRKSSSNPSITGQPQADGDQGKPRSQ